MPGLGIIFGQHKGQIKWNHALKLVEHRVQQLRISEARNEHFKNLFNGPEVLCVALVFLDQAQIFISKSGVAQQGGQHFDIFLGIHTIVPR